MPQWTPAPTWWMGLKKWLKVSSLAATSLCVTAGVRGDDAASNRLLPLVEKIPGGFDYETLEKLGPKWQSWSEETLALVEALYETALDDAAQQQTLAKLDIKLGTIRKALNDPAYAAIHVPLADLYGKLSRRLEVYSALAAVLRGGASGAAPARPAGSPLAEARAAFSELESSLLVIPQGPSWLPFIAADRLTPALADNDLSDDDRATITLVLGRLNTQDNVSEEQRTFLAQPMFRRLADALAASLADGGAPPQPLDPDAALRSLAADLLRAIEDYEASGSREAAARLRTVMGEIVRVGGEAGTALAKVIDRHYASYNLQVIASEDFFRRFFEQSRSDSGRVNEYMDEVYVSGCQWTDTEVSVDLKPREGAAQFMLTLDGKVRSSTTGEVCNVTVYNSGAACFRAEKDILFDGTHFTLCPARVGVNANNCAYDAETCLEFLPVARGLARNIALSQAEQRKPESDAFARRRISGQVRTRFDRETGEQFSKAEDKLETKFYGPLGELSLRPEVAAFSSSETELYVRERLMGEGELSGGLPPQATVPATGALIQMHQSLLSNGADRFGFAGERLTAPEMNARISERLDRIFPNREKKEPAEPRASDNARLIFDTVDPISFQFEDGQIVMSLRAGLERPGEEEIPTQIISVPLKITVEGDELVLTRGSVGVKPVVRPDNIGAQIARANIMRERIAEGIPERQTQKATFELDAEGKQIVLSITSVIAEDGWFTLTAE